MRLNFCVACGERDHARLEDCHLVPRADNGSDDESNIITLCNVCHGLMHSVGRAPISELTKKGLAAAKARGVKLGGNRGNLAAVSKKARENSAIVRRQAVQRRAADLAPIMLEIRAGGASTLRQIAAEMNARKIRAARGGEWSAAQVKPVLERA